MKSKAKPKLKIGYTFEPNQAQLDRALNFLAQDFKNRVNLIKELATLKKK